MTNYSIRNYRSSDFDDYVRLHREAERLEPRGKPVSPQVISEILSWPGRFPEQNLFLVIYNGGIIGCMDLLPELGIGRVILDCWLHPEHRDKGLPERLLGNAMRSARELGAGVVHVNIMEDNAVAGKVLTRLGFKCVRRFLELELDMERLRLREAAQAARECRPLGPGDEEKLTRIQNRSFDGTWGYNPNTVETITYHTHLSHFSRDDVVLTYEGDRVTGYCWAWLIPGKDRRKGRVHMLGVEPDYRGKGLGRKLLLAGLHHLRSKGARVAVLTVDSENRVACALYHSVGFETRAGSWWYEKAVAQDTGVS